MRAAAGLVIGAAMLLYDRAATDLLQVVVLPAVVVVAMWPLLRSPLAIALTVALLAARAAADQRSPAALYLGVALVAAGAVLVILARRFRAAMRARRAARAGAP